MDLLPQRACLVIGIITLDSYAYLSSYTTIGHALDLMTTLISFFFHFEVDV